MRAVVSRFVDVRMKVVPHIAGGLRYAVPLAKCDGSIELICAICGSSGGVTSIQ